MAALDYSFVQRVIDGTGRILDTTMSNPNTGSYITEAQLRDWIKGQTVQEGYYYNGNFYSDSGHTSVMAKVNGSLYVDKGSNALYYCLSSAYMALTEEAAVQAIRTELLNGTLEPLVSTKARQDANGDVIDTTYATKAELAAEESAREAGDTNLKNALSATNKRVTNLELKTGDQFDVDYPSDTYGMDGVPSNVEPYAKVKTSRGVGRIANQLFNYTDVTSATINGLTITNNNDGSVTVNGTATATTVRLLVPQEAFVANHFYVAGGCPRGGSTNTYQITGIVNGSRYGIEVGDGSIIPMPSSFTSAGLYIYIPSGTVCNNLVFKPLLRDLNVYFNTTDLSFLGATDSAKLATIQQKYPELLIPSDYGTEVVFPTYSAVKSKGKNILNEADYSSIYQFEYSNGVFSNTGTDTRSFFQLTIQCLSNGVISTIAQLNIQSTGRKSLTFNTPATNVDMLVVKHNGSAADFTVRYANIGMPLNTQIVFSFDVLGYNPQVVGGVRFKNVQIEVGSSATDYTHYMTDTLTLTEPVTLKGVGSVAEEYYPETGKATHPIGQVDMATMAWSYNSTYDCYTCNLSDYSGTDGAYICANYANGGARAIENMASAQKGIYNWGKRLQVKDSASPTGILYFALATPSADTYVDPILDPFIQVEGGGTIKPVQSQSPEVDSAMTVRYMAS